MNKTKLFFVFFIIILLALAGAVVAEQSADPDKKVKKNLGKAKFVDTNVQIDFLEDILSEKELNKLLKGMKTKKNKVEIDSFKYPELNKAAKVTFKNVGFMDYPMVYHNNEWRPDVTPTRKGNDYEIYVDGFSSWELVDSTFNGTFNFTTIIPGGDLAGALSLTPKAQLFYRFEDDTYSGEAEDYSAYDNTGNRNTPARVTPIQYGTDSYSFDDENDFIWSYVNETYEDLSVFAWIKTSNGQIQNVVGQYDSTTSSRVWRMMTGNTNKVMVYIGASGGGAVAVQATTVDTFALGALTHIGFSFRDGEGITDVFINGQNVSFTGAQVYTELNKLDPAQPIEIGSSNGGTAVPFDGEIQCVQMFYETLTQPQVNYMYLLNDCNETLGPGHTWKLDQYEESPKDYARYINFATDTVYPYTRSTNDPEINYFTCAKGYSCLNWDGDNDYVSLDNEPSLNDTDEFTINTFFKYSGDSGSLHHYLAGGFSGDGSYPRILVGSAGSSATLQHKNSSGGLEEIVLIDGTLSNGNWRMITYVFNGTDILGYIDGVLIKNISTGSGVQSGITNTNYFGRDAGSTYFLNGSIECVSVYDIALDEDYIVTLNNSDSCLVEPGFETFEGEVETTVGIGTYNGGDEISYEEVDGDVYNVSENAGTPSFLTSYNISMIDNFDAIEVKMYIKYNASASNSMDLSVWNLSSSSWLKIYDIVGGGYEWYNLSLESDAAFDDFINWGMDGSEILLKINRTETGNATNNLLIDAMYVEGELYPVDEYPFNNIADAETGPWQIQDPGENYMKFDGNGDCIDIENQIEFDAPDIWSVGGWLYITNSGDDPQAIVTNDFILGGLWYNQTDIIFGANSADYVEWSSVITPGTWQHVWVNYNSSDPELFINAVSQGLPSGSLTPTAAWNAAGSINTVGCNHDGSKNGFSLNGRLANLYILDYVPDSFEIQEIMNEELYPLFSEEGDFISQVFNVSDYEDEVEINFWSLVIVQGQNVTASEFADEIHLTDNFYDDFSSFNNTRWELESEGFNNSILWSGSNILISGESTYEHGGSFGALLTNETHLMGVPNNDWYIASDVYLADTLDTLSNHTIAEVGVFVENEDIGKSHQCIIVYMNDTMFGGALGPALVLTISDSFGAGFEVNFTPVTTNNGRLEFNYNSTTGIETCSFNGSEVSFHLPSQNVSSAAGEYIFAAGVSTMFEGQNSSGELNAAIDNIEVWSAGGTMPPSGTSPGLNVYGRANSCLMVESDNWIEANHYYFGGNSSNQTFDFMGGGIQGECFQYKLDFASDGDISPTVINVTVESLKLLKPWLENVTITNMPPVYSNDIIHGNVMPYLNDTDSFNITFEWYVNGINVYNETFVTNNGSMMSTNLNSSYTSSGDYVNFSGQPFTYDYNGYFKVFGNTVWSNTIYINNSNFTVQFFPSFNNFSMESDEIQVFQAIVNDSDGDVVCNWFLDGAPQGSGFSSTLDASTVSAGIHIVSVDCSDMEFTQLNSWNVMIEEIEASGQDGANMIIGLFIMAIIAACFALAFKGEFIKNPFANMVIRRSFLVIGLFGLAYASGVIAAIAQGSGVAAYSEMFFLLMIFGWAGYVALIYLVIRTILDLLELWKIKKHNRRFGDDN